MAGVETANKHLFSPLLIIFCEGIKWCNGFKDTCDIVIISVVNLRTQIIPLETSVLKSSQQKNISLGKWHYKSTSTVKHLCSITEGHLDPPKSLYHTSSSWCMHTAVNKNFIHKARNKSDHLTICTSLPLCHKDLTSERAEWMGQGEQSRGEKFFPSPRLVTQPYPALT